MSVEKIIRQLDLQPYPEGGWYRRNFTSPTMLSTSQGERPSLTSIFYLLGENHLSRWHVIRSTELWHFYKGAPLELIAYQPDTRLLQKSILGNDLDAGQILQANVPGKTWQSARSLELCSKVVYGRVTTGLNEVAYCCYKGFPTQRAT